MPLFRRWARGKGGKGERGKGGKRARPEARHGVKARKVIKIANELLSLGTPIGDEENGHLSDFIEGQGPLEK
jgi:DNA-directed RNA polymerase sigma subunit (sigma70/sigma32)